MMHLRRVLFGLFALTGLAGLSVAQVAVPSGSTDLVVRREGLANRVAFVTGRAGTEPIRDAAGLPFTTPDAFLAQRASVFGVTDPAHQLSLSRTRTDNLGWITTRYQQVFHDIPVFTGVLKVHQNARAEVVVANGAFRDVSPKLNTVPNITPAQAAAKARQADGFNQADVTSSKLVVVDPGWYGDRPRGAHLAYHVVLSDPAASYLQAFFIDAHTGEILDSWTLVESAKYREIHDGMGGSSLPGTTVRTEGDSPTGDYDTDAAYDYYGDVYDYYLRAFGRDSIDGAGLTMVATVHSTAPGCPNAYWNGVQMVFCDGTVTDDVVAHELTHGVTQYSANLIYQNQPGQLNESFSDVFGELIDLFNGDVAFPGPPSGPSWPTTPTGPGLDTPNNLRTACSPASGYPDGVRWLVGEDATAFGGAIRDMWDPTCDGQPDTANSPLEGCSAYDNGGVHGGSGVPNHAFALVTDGGTFNSFSITGIGPIKAGAVWYRALTTYLTPGSDFEDAYWAINQAATDLIGTTPNDPRTGTPSASAFTAADATSVDNALRAVEMNSPGLCGGDMQVLDSAPGPDCSPMTTLYANDFEGATTGWTVGNSTSGTAYDWALTTTPLPLGRAGRAYLVANDPPHESGDQSGTHWLDSPVIAVPPSMNFPVLSFTHWLQSEPRWDGGTVWISVDGAPFTEIPNEDFFYNGYNDILFASSQGNSNPRAGLRAFTGVGGQWGTSLAFLGNVVPPTASTIQIRFEFSKDQCCGALGWYLDDFSVFDCTAETDCNNNGVPDALEQSLAGDDDLIWARQPALATAFRSDADPDSGSYQTIATLVRLMMSKPIEELRLWGTYSPSDTPPAPNFTLRIYQPDPGNNNLPGTLEYAEDGIAAARTPVGTRSGLTLYEVTLTPGAPLNLSAGEHWVEIRDNSAGSADSFIWSCSDYDVGYQSLIYSNGTPPVTSWSTTSLNPSMSLEIVAAPPPLPCIGDLNGDCSTNVFDFTVFAGSFGDTGIEPYTAGDLDGDGNVTVFDFSIFATDFGCTP